MSQFYNSNLPQTRKKRIWDKAPWFNVVPITLEMFVWSVRPLLSANNDSGSDFLMYCTV